jgi:NodT family efflux transporter outer membrane factor (OMF) lipoprotein
MTINTCRFHIDRGARLLLGVLALSACTVGPDFKSPTAPTTQRYTTEPGAALALADAAALEQRVAFGKKTPVEWWRQFNSPELDGVIALAIAKNHTLAAAQATLAESQEAVKVAAGAFYPQVDVSASVGRQKLGAAFLGPVKFPAFSFFSIGPNVSYALDVFGGIKRQVENREALAQSQGYRLDAAYLTVTGNVATSALAIASARAQIATVEDILGNDEQNLSLVRTARRAGAVTDVDVLSAESQLANDRTLLPPLRQQLSAARHALAILCGQAPGDWSAPSFDLDRLTLPGELPASLPSGLVHERPDIMSAESDLHAASAAVGVATANLYPRITLTGSVSQEATDLAHLFDPASMAWSIAGGLTAPIFHGGELEATRRAAVDAYQAALANYEQTVLQSFGQVADVLQALAHDAEQLAAQQHALQSADASLKLTRLSYAAGNVGVLQVLDAERLYQQARLGYVRAEAQRYLDTTQLFLAMGGGALARPRDASVAAGAP